MFPYFVLCLCLQRVIGLVLKKSCLREVKLKSYVVLRALYNVTTKHGFTYLLHLIKFDFFPIIMILHFTFDQTFMLRSFIGVFLLRCFIGASITNASASLTA